MKNYKLVTAIVTIYLLVYTILQQMGASLTILAVMFALSPVLILWMTFTILRYAPYKGPELEEIKVKEEKK
ncbi:MAG: hypothetical protein JWN76_153 [Chitinophagaceae bacterium]|nr:hypothetical protein [Chitinophagaceae bacterium]